MIINTIIVLFFLISAVFSVRYGFMQFRAFRETGKVLVKDKNKSAYSTFMVSLASHLGTGNIVGISSALILGGPGSLFWMWVYAILSSIFSLMENTLSQVYKEKINGENRGGTCYYMKKGLNSTILAFFFAVFLMLANTVFFQPLQINTVSETIHLTFGIDKLIILISLLIFAYLIIFKGTMRIVRFCEAIVPVMSIGYIAVTTMIVLANLPLFPNVLMRIFRDAFDWEAIVAGGGYSCLMIGIKRSLFSHEAGLGTMPSISAMAEPKQPLQQGFLNVVGVFTDTILMCSLTGFVLLIYEMDLSSYQGVDLILDIFQKMLGGFGIVLAVFFLLTFAISTVVSEFYLGESNLLYLIKGRKGKKVYNYLYKCLFSLGIIIGVNNTTSSIFTIVDNGMILLGVCNLYALFRLRKVFEREIRKYYE